MRTSETISKISPALARAQMHIGGAEKSSTNPFHKSKYASLVDVILACKEALCKEGISVLQMVGSNEAGAFTMSTMLLHESGEWISATMQMPIPQAKANDPQAMGSAVTYCRRYQLQALLNIPAVDDDGEFARKVFSEPASKALEQKAINVESETVDTVASGEPEWQVKLEQRIFEHEEAVNDFLISRGVIKEGGTWRDLPNGPYRNRVCKEPQKFLDAVLAGGAK